MALSNTDLTASPGRPSTPTVPTLAIKPVGTLEIPENTILSSLDSVINWCRKYRDRKSVV
jgi:NADH-quinone oxidoreductase subunit B